LILTVAGLPVALHYLGIAGAAWVSTAAYFARSGINAFFLRRKGVRHIFPSWSDLNALGATTRKLIVAAGSKVRRGGRG
jgi:hypothetical protein